MANNKQNAYIESVDEFDDDDYDKSAVRDFRSMGIKFNEYEFKKMEQGSNNLRLAKLTYLRFASCLLAKIAEQMTITEKYELNLSKPEFILDLVDIDITRKRSKKKKA